MCKILIVDDDADLLFGMNALFRKLKYETATASSRLEMLQKLQQFSASIILLDYYLEGDDGRQICNYLKTESKYHHIPIIILSADPLIQRTALKFGADGFLNKPFDINDLLIKITVLTEPLLAQ